MQIYNYKNLTKDFYEKIEFGNLENVEKIITDVRNSGDSAVINHSKIFGDGDITDITVSKEEIEKAYEQVDKRTLDALKFSINNVKVFAERQLACLRRLDTVVGLNQLGHRINPIEKAGCYIPGGNYPLPSSAVMTIVPAKVAGVKKIVACSPKIQPVTIVACDLAGADVIYRIGGVQAIAAMAYGTQTVEKVHKIVGPGNKYVTAAKKFVYGECGIDFLAGPSEVMIIADDTANPKFVAADILAQCEHDLDAKAYLICFSEEFAHAVLKEAEEFLKILSTADIARVSFEKSFVVIADNVSQALEIAEKRAPEHLELCFAGGRKYLDELKNYGSLFIGNYSAEAFGDYTSGINHTLPTNQVAKYSGGLSVFDFVKIQTYQMVSNENLTTMIEYTGILAEKEGLQAHKLAAEIRKC